MLITRNFQCSIHGRRIGEEANQRLRCGFVGTLDIVQRVIMRFVVVEDLFDRGDIDRLHLVDGGNGQQVTALQEGLPVITIAVDRLILIHQMSVQQLFPWTIVAQSCIQHFQIITFLPVGNGEKLGWDWSGDR